MKEANKLILGTVQFGLNYGINNIHGKPKKIDVFEILSFAYDKGIRLLDTAEMYGNAHELIGEFHKTHPNKKFQIITKFSHDIFDTLEKRICRYLSQLNVDHLNAILFHSFESYFQNKKQLKNILKFKNILFKYIGVSVYTNEEIKEVLSDSNIDIIQMPFNIFDNVNLRGELIEKAKLENRIIHTRSAFLQGLFFSKKDDSNNIRVKLNHELSIIENISIKVSMPIGSIALNYCLGQSNIDGVVIGVDSLDQLIDNIDYAQNVLPVKCVNEINKIRIKNIELLNPTKW